MRPTKILRNAWGLEAAVEPLGDGLINDTYLVGGVEQPLAHAGNASRTDVGFAGRAAPEAGDVGNSASPFGSEPVHGGAPLVLQRVNSSVFKDPERLMANVARVTAHLCAKQPAWTPSLVPTAEGNFHVFESGEVWRLWTYLPGASALRTVETDRQAETVGIGFGRTYRWLQDLPGPRLKDTIPGFLQLEHYLAEFDRCRDVPRELAAAIGQRRSLAARFRKRSGYIHGDCRVEHLVLNEVGEAVGVVDLDTVMWGNWAWEFGDLVRSMSGNRPVVSQFEAAARGYVGEARIVATAEDLVLAPRYTTFMLGVRFLTDHLRGDRYFKVSKPGENVARAQAQFRLLAVLETLESEMLRRAQAVLNAA